MRILIVVFVVGFLVEFAIPAQSDVPQATALRLADQLPPGLLQQIRRRPAAFFEDAADVILSFGQNGAIGPEGLETAVLASRARVRARTLERFLAADLDNDGLIAPTEMDGLIARTYPGGRGRLKVLQFRADRNGDGSIQHEELRQFAEAEAMDAAGDQAMTEALALMCFDLDGDGTVRLDEVTRGVEMIGAVDLAMVRKDI